MVTYRELRAAIDRVLASLGGSIPNYSIQTDEEFTYRLDIAQTLFLMFVDDLPHGLT